MYFNKAAVIGILANVVFLGIGAYLLYLLITVLNLTIKALRKYLRGN